MKSNYNYNPFQYYCWTLGITWVSLLIAAWLSHKGFVPVIQYTIMLIGMLTPCLVAIFMIYLSKNDELKKDFERRIVVVSLIKSENWFSILFIMPFALISSTAISILLGHSEQQFTFSESFSTSIYQAIMSLVAVVLAPLFEELGWRGYGVDSLNRKGRSLLTSTLIFSLLWNLWHLPLFFIKGYYHYEILHTNIFYAFNFVVSIFPAALLSNWIFYTNNRSILAVIIFHSILNLCSVLLQTEQFTKGIITLILLLLSGLIVFRNKELFMKIEDVKRVKL